MASEGLTQGGIIENEREKVKLAQLHGDLDAMIIIQDRLLTPLRWISPEVIQVLGTSQRMSFEGKKHLWNMLSRLTSRVETAILNDRQLAREVIHLAVKGRNL